MNIQNISALSDQLQSLGFGNTGYLLLKRICFKPDSFLLPQKIEKGKDKLTFQLFFERNSRKNIYFLNYYDAILQKETVLIDATINSININTLEKSMSEIDWENAFDFNSKKLWDAEDKAGWEKEDKIESVIDAFNELEKSEEGRGIAVGLKVKYWSGLKYQELLTNISPLKSKSEVTQRFYFFEGQQGISVDEAYRFLQNKWQEKQLQFNRKEPVSNMNEVISEEEQMLSGHGLVRNKHFNTSKKSSRKSPTKK